MTKKKQSTESVLCEIRRRTRRKFSPEAQIRVVLEGLRGEVQPSCFGVHVDIASDRALRHAGEALHAQASTKFKARFRDQVRSQATLTTPRGRSFPILQPRDRGCSG